MEKKRGRTAAQEKYDKANVETISFKTKKGAREQLKAAAMATGQSTNGFIRSALNAAVQNAIGEPMERDKEESNSEEAQAIECHSRPQEGLQRVMTAQA